MDNQTLILINLRGGADGLNMVVPYKEENYYKLRPTIALARPDEKDGVLDLDGFFGLHPALAPLLPLYQNRQLAILHATGWKGQTHSHFEAWEEIELGITGQEKPTTGWLARYLQLASQTEKKQNALQTINFSSWPTKLFIGCPGTSKISELSDFCLRSKNTSSLISGLKLLYQSDDAKSPTASIANIGQQTISTLEEVNKILQNQQVSSSNYPKTRFGNQLQSVEQLIQANIKLSAVSIDLNGWDTHILQGGAKGHMANLLLELASGISSFAENLKDKWDKVILVVMTEFGRRVAENGSGGTEHGQGGVMFFAGGKINGGRVFGDWPGLSTASLSGPGDLTITTDFRTALSEIIMPQVVTIEKIFPNYQITKNLGILLNQA